MLSYILVLFLELQTDKDARRERESEFRVTRKI